MSATANILPKYSYFKTHPLSQVLIEELLLPGLARQGQYSAAAAGIELPHSENETPQYLPLREAALLIIGWLETNRNLASSEATALYKLLETPSTSASFKTLVNILVHTYRERIQEPEINFTAAVRENLERYRASQSQTTTTAGYDPNKIIDAYNQTYHQLHQIITSGTPAAIAAQFLPINRHSPIARSTQRALAEIIAGNLDRLLHAGNLHPGDTKDSQILQNHDVTRELEKLIKTKYPEHTNLLNFTGDPDFQNKLHHLVLTTADDYLGSQSRVSKLGKYSRQRLTAAQALSFIIPSFSKLETDLTQAFSQANIPITQSRALATALQRELIRSGKHPLSPSTLVDRTLRRLNLDSSHRQLILTTLNTPKFQTAFTYHSQTLSRALRTHPPNYSERRLLARGINPFVTRLPATELRRQAQTLLPPQPLPADNLVLEQMVQDLYSRELSSQSPDYSRLRALRSWLDYAHPTFQLNNKERVLARRARSQHNLPNFLSRLQRNQYTLSNKLYQIEENLPWNVGLRKAFETYDKLAERIVLPLPFTKGKVKIPLLRFWPWAFDRWHNFKTNRAIAWLKNLRGTRSPFGKFAQFGLRHYLKGGSTFSGLFYSAGREFWSKRVAKPLLKLTARAGKSALESGGKFLAKFGLKVGAEALAKLGAKAIATLAAAGTVLGTVFSVIGIISIAWDLLKLGFNFIKEFFRNVNFRQQVLKIGAIIGAILSFQWFAPIGIFLAGIAALALQTLLLAGAVTLSLVAFFLIFFNVFIKLPMNIDAAPDQLLASLVCNQSSSETGDPRVNAAVCIVETLTKCSLNPLSSSLLGGNGWKCALTALAKPQVADAIFQSTHGNGLFQCVGFIAATAAWIGKPVPQIDACAYVNNAPAGYRYYSGTANLSLGDFFVIGSSHCSDSNPGHVGVVCGINGALITACDANYGTPGGVRTDGRFAKSQITGYLKAN